MLRFATIHKFRKLIFLYKNCLKSLNKQLGELNHLSNQGSKSTETL
jgi:hypothetical protein